MDANVFVNQYIPKQWEISIHRRENSIQWEFHNNDINDVMQISSKGLINRIICMCLLKINN